MELVPLRPPDSSLAPPPFGRIVTSGIDLSKSLDEKTLEAIDAALTQHGLLIFQGQRCLIPEMEWAFVSSLPWLDKEFSTSLKTSHVAWWQFAECPMVRRLGDAVDDTGKPLALLNRIGYEWHTDGGGASYLYCERAPHSPRRTTLFASGAAAYEALPADRRIEAERIMVHYSVRFVTGDTAAVDYNAGARMAPSGLRLAKACTERGPEGHATGKGAHARPLVRVHPRTSRKVLWASPKNMDHLEIDGCALSVERSRETLEELMRYGTATQDTALVYEHRWKAGDVTLIDNRHVLHSTTPYPNERDDHGQQLMHHISVKARRPQPGWSGVGILGTRGDGCPR